MAANEYQTPGVYLPPASGVIHHTPRDRTQVDPDAKGDDKAVAKATDVPASQAVRKGEEASGPGTGGTNADDRSGLGPKTDPATLVMAQEKASEAEKAARAEDAKRAAVASAAEMVGAPEELVRLDENRDGRIDQLELKHAFRAEGEDSTYAALSHYRKSLGFGESPQVVEKQDQKPEKLFADEIAAAEKAKLSGETAPSEAAAAAQSEPTDPNTSPDNVESQVKIVI